MVWDASTGVFNLTYCSGLPTESIISTPDKAGVFPSFYSVKTFLASSLYSTSSDKFPLASSPSYPPSNTLSRLLLFLLSFWSLPRGIYQTICILMHLMLSIFLPLPSCSLGSNRHIVVLIIFLLLWWWLFWGSSFGATASTRRANLPLVTHR